MAWERNINPHAFNSIKREAMAKNPNIYTIEDYAKDNRVQRILSWRHRVLVDEYFKCNFNKDEAVRRAGFTSDANSYSNRLFRRPDVVAEISRRRKRLAEKMELTTDWIVSRLMILANSNLTLAKFMRVDDLGQVSWNFEGASPEELACIKELTLEKFLGGREGGGGMKFKVSGQDSLAALNSLARIQGLFKDKVEVSGPGSLVEKLNKGRERVNSETEEATEE